MIAALEQLQAERKRRSDFKHQLQSGELIEARGVEAAIATGVPRGENFGAGEVVTAPQEPTLGKPALEPPRRRDYTEHLPPPPMVTSGPERIDIVTQDGTD